MKKLILAAILTLISLPSYAQVQRLNPNAMEVNGTALGTLLDTPVINLKNVGACGVADATTLMNTVFVSAKAENKSVYHPEGCVVYHSGVITNDSVNYYGDGVGSLLYATNTSASNPTDALMLTGTNASVSSIKLSGAWSGTRQTNNGSSRVLVSSANNFSVENLVIDNSASASIMVYGGSNGLVRKNSISGGLADGIHLTYGTNNVKVTENTVVGTGDDKIAVVSYVSNPSISHDIIISNNYVKGGTARGITAVGGENINIIGNIVDGVTSNSGIYVASEHGNLTNYVKNIVVSGNNIHGSGNATGELSSILVVGNTTDALDASGILINGNTIKDSVSSAIRVGTSLSNPSHTTDVVVSNNIIDTTFSGNGVKIQGSKNVSVLDNIIRSTYAYGVYAGEAGWNSGYLKIEGNSFYGLNTAANATIDAISIYQSGFSPVSIQNNTQINGGTTIDKFVESDPATDINVLFEGNTQEDIDMNLGGVTSVAYGRQALGAQTARNQGNTAIGASSGNAVTSGSNNTLVGRSAGLLINTATNNTIVGFQVGSTTLTTGSGNVLIGTSNSVTTPSSSTSNYMNIGNGVRGYMSTPTIGSGFGTGASIPAGLSTFAFRVNVGTGGTAQNGVISLGASTNGWNCNADDVTTPASNSTRMISSTTTGITLQNYSRTTGAPAAWTASDILAVSCVAY